VNRIVATPAVQAWIHDAGFFPVTPATSADPWGGMFGQDVRTRAGLAGAPA
jgi:hypothetical protein